MERKICKRCGDSIYFDSDYCLECSEDIELERLSKLTKEEFEKEYSLIIDDVLSNRKFTQESASRLRRLMMINEKISPNLQTLCARLGLSDVVEVYYGANEKTIEDLEDIKSSKNPKDWGLEICYDVATCKADWLNIGNKDCYEFIADEFDMNEDFVSSITTVKIIDTNGKTYEIEDFFKCCEDMVDDDERIDNNQVITFRARNRVSPFLPRFNERTNTLGGFLCEDFDNLYDECEECGEEMLHFAQLSARQFGFDEGCFQLSRCKECGNIQVRFEQT